MGKQNNCIICDKIADVDTNEKGEFFCSCSICGRYQYYDISDFNDFNLNHLSAYLAYNGFRKGNNEYRYFTTMSKEKCDEYKNAFMNGDSKHGHPVRLEYNNVENWYPKTFAEKVDYILLYLNSHIRHMGENITLEKEELFSFLFVDRYDNTNKKSNKRTDGAMVNQVNYMIEYLSDRKYINFFKAVSNCEFNKQITLEPEGYNRIDTLQKNTNQGRKVFIAMKFGDKTKQLRESIRKGIMDAKYIPEFIDEVQHNDFITLEILKHIKDSKFIVVELTHKNNGAYFEEGYALGLGKQVIQICKKGKKLHFDIAQKNTIMWSLEDEISEKLKNRIIATID